MNRKPTPPRLLLRFFKWFCHPSLHVYIEGDLLELYQERVEKAGKRKADWRFALDVLLLFRPSIIKPLEGYNQLNHYGMFRHNLLITYRSILRNKTSFFINLVGLSTSLACALLIYFWVNDELSVDKFHEKDNRLYQVMRNWETSNNVLTFEGTPGRLAYSLVEEMPEVEMAIADRPSFNNKGILSTEKKQIKASERYVSQDFFNIFSYNLIHGNNNEAFSDKYAVVLSDELALKLFNTTADIIGKTIEWDHGDFSGSYLISGVFKTPPSNSSMQFDILFSYELFLEKRPEFLNWDNSNPATYVLLKEDTDIDLFNKKIAGFVKSKLPTSKSTLFLRQYSDQYLYGTYENGIQTGGRITYVKLFSIVATFILIIACINFMNLSTARASRRLKEIGIKKAIGAKRKTLIIQFLSESIAMAFLSLTVSFLLILILLPQFHYISGKQLTLTFDASLILSVLGFVVFIGFLSGSYPALYYSGFRPTAILKEKLLTSTGELWIRKGLVIFQFTVSVILISSVFIVSKQLSFIQKKNLGYNKDNIIYFTNEGKVLEGLEIFLAEIKKISGVVHASNFANDLTGKHGSTSGLNWEGKNPDESISFGNLEVGYDLIELLEIEVVAGRTFSSQFNSERSKIIFNESAVKAMGLENPVGKTVKLWGEDRQIIGIVKDFHFESLYKEIRPCFLQLYPISNQTLVRIKVGTETETLTQLQKFYQEYNQGLPFDYQFLDQDYQALYAAEKRVSTLSQYFAGIAILISCLGLLGLAAFASERRTKEISIRKILGSSIWRIIGLLSIDFAKMVLVAILIAMPVSFVILKRWLENFSYRINMEWWIFALAGLVAIIIAFVTISSQSIKAALSNPVDALKNE
ncbi:MAG: ABC transporter permease [Bacteroidota bacterium]